MAIQGMMQQQQLLYINSELALQSYRFYNNFDGSLFKNVTPLLGSQLPHKRLHFKHFVVSDLNSLVSNDSIKRTILVLTPITNVLASLEDLRIMESLDLEIKLIANSEVSECESFAAPQFRSFTTKEIIKYPPIYQTSDFEFYRDKTILITGAGGSIGNELIDFVQGIEFDKLILLDHSEHAIHRLKLKTKDDLSKDIEIVIGSIRDKNKLRTVFQKHNINIVFHLAAYKHVGIMETDLYEAFKCNVIGTKNLLDLSERFEVDQFNFISTDKAVNPLGVMGLTKKLAESYILNTESHTKVVILRFGNVFGSSGSVVENFESAISNNICLRISHKHMRRYFTLPKDVASFILSSPLYANPKDTMVFNIPEQTAILTLARVILLLKGYPNDEHYPVEIRNGEAPEKLQEELYSTVELIENTEQDHIKRIPFMIEDNNIIDHIQDFNAILNKYPGRANLELLKSLYNKTKIMKA